MINELKRILKLHFKLKDLRELRYYFRGFELARSKEFIVLNPQKYCLELISNVSLIEQKSVATPLELNVKLTTSDYDTLFHTNKDDARLVNEDHYIRIIDQLVY